MRIRLVVAAVAMCAFVLLIVQLPLGLTYAGREQDRLLGDLERDARVIATSVEDRLEQQVGGQDITADLPSSELLNGYAGRTDARVLVTDERGRSLFDTDAGPGRDYSTRPEVAAALSGGSRTGVRDSTTLGTDVLFAAVPVASSGRVLGVVRLTLSGDDLNARVLRNWAGLAGVAVLVLVGAGVLAAALAGWIVRPLTRLEVVATELAAGRLDARVAQAEGPSEVRRLAAVIDDMAERLGALIDAQRSFAGDASHQLRTPLTALRLRLDSLAALVGPAAVVDPVAGMASSGVAPDRHQGGLTADQTERLRAGLAEVDAEVARLGRLVEGLLTLARVEGGSAPRATEDVVPVVRSRVELWSAMGAEQGVVVAADLPERASADVVPGAVEQIVDNLIDNALDALAGRAGGRVAVAVRCGPGAGGLLGELGRSEPEHVVIEVCDNGPGLPAADLERMFERFWRGASAAPGGTGLGLAIVAQLVRACGGAVTAESSPSGGLCVRIRLSVNDAPPAAQRPVAM